MRRRTIVAVPLAAAAAPLAAGTAASAHRTPGPKPTIVLVHGAFADASGFTEVVKRLQRNGYPVLAPANPLRGVDSDSAYVRAVLSGLTGPIVLVGHSYGGFVATNAATGNANVKALVYVAAFAPDAGDTVESLSAKFPGSRLGPDALDLRPNLGSTPDGYIKQSLFHEVFCADLPASTAAAMAATQRPADLATLRQPSGVPAWKTIPAWTLVAKDDRVIPADTQRFMARRAGARVVEVRASHVAMTSKPDTTVDLILAAARSTAQGA
ncbi:alpha/beta fold hydrolase [Virgisporangium ochraceum]|uniref:Alpha/beta hydrolase n=1 Tax=Virgisporangium ochraceum TaxID=65505 RepID=A0A8J3ZVK1_9ACTN|nr:alpha/beta hydrolase [Virgisporangium ochraceum]GIJ70456.1 alpha/beta hydrolase [Virgisporangium ochraceum]